MELYQVIIDYYCNIHTHTLLNRPMFWNHNRLARLTQRSVYGNRNNKTSLISKLMGDNNFNLL